MSSQTASRIIRHSSIRICEMLSGGKLYGQLLDMENLDSLIVAAYFMGQADALQKSSEQLKFLTGPFQPGKADAMRL